MSKSRLLLPPCSSKISHAEHQRGRSGYCCWDGFDDDYSAPNLCTTLITKTTRLHGVDIKSIRLCDDEMDKRVVRGEVTFDGVSHRGRWMKCTDDPHRNDGESTPAHKIISHHPLLSVDVACGFLRTGSDASPSGTDMISNSIVASPCQTLSIMVPHLPRIRIRLPYGLQRLIIEFCEPKCTWPVVEEHSTDVPLLHRYSFLAMCNMITGLRQPLDELLRC